MLPVSNWPRHCAYFLRLGQVQPEEAIRFLDGSTFDEAAERGGIEQTYADRAAA